MAFQHTTLAEGRWQTLTLPEQLGNIGSEVSRASRWQGRDEGNFRHAADRALELFDLTLRDQRWAGRRFELARAREVFCDAISGGSEYKSSLADLESYFFSFAYLARNKV